MASKLFQTKSPELLMRESEAPDRKMKRSLTAFDLTCLGIGAIIGAGIFALAGTAAAGESAHVGESIVKTPVLNFIIACINHTDLVFGRPAAGPAVALSFVVAAIACGFAALCYSELAVDDPGFRLSLHLFLRDAGRDHRLDHRLGFDSGIRGRQHGRGCRAGLAILSSCSAICLSACT